MTDIKNLWQSQKAEDDVIALADIHARAGKFRGRIRWRNVLIYIYFIGFVLSGVRVLIRQLSWQSQGRPQSNIFGSYFAFDSIVIMAIAVACWIMFAVWWRARVKPVPAELAGSAALDFHRRELERQRAAAASAWVWFVLPLTMPSVFAFAVLAYRSSHVYELQPILMPLAIGYAFFYGAIWLLFSRSSVKLELELERLKRLRAE